MGTFRYYPRLAPGKRQVGLEIKSVYDHAAACAKWHEGSAVTCLDNDVLADGVRIDRQDLAFLKSYTHLAEKGL